MHRFHASRLVVLLLLASRFCSAGEGADGAAAVYARAGKPGGVLLQVGCGDGALTVELGRNEAFTVFAVDTDPAAVAATRTRIAAAGMSGRVTADLWDGAILPPADNLVTVALLPAEPSDALRAEAMRVLSPEGVLLLPGPDGLSMSVKPWPADMDDWPHYLRGADNNAVAHDPRIGPPRSLQWTGSPRWARHHDRLPSLSAMVSAGGRVFYIFDEGPTASILLPSRWSLIARDAFNGVVLWKVPIPEWQTRLWPLKSGPAQLPRRLVATADTVYATLGIDVPVSALDARTGAILRTYPGTEGAEEILHDDGTLFVLANPEPNLEKYRNPASVQRPWWDGEKVRVVALEAASGKVLWEHASAAMPLTLSADASRVYFHDGDKLVCLNRTDGKPLWDSLPLDRAARIMSFFAPTLVVQDGVVLFAGGEESGLVKSGGGATKSDTITALDAATGKTLWQAPHPPSGYSSPEDVFVIGGTVWCGAVSNGSLPGSYTGIDLHTGEVKHSFEAADADTYWFHHRCHRGKAADRFLMVSRTGIECIDPQTGHWDTNHWVRGGCMYGIMPANGFIYTPPHDCACYPESKLFGMNALASQAPALPPPGNAAGRLTRGPAYGTIDPAAPVGAADWPTYRGNNRRSGFARETLPPELKESWKTQLPGPLSAVTVAGGRAYLASTDAHLVHAINTADGSVAWSFVAGGRVDSPPTVVGNAVVFGCADGRAYCLRAADGAVAWTFRAAPMDSRIMAFERPESRWPLHGSLLVRENVVYALAGRSLFLDGGMRLCRLRADTGELLSEEALDERDPGTGENIQSHVTRLSMPVALPDVLSADDRNIYMRSQVFDFDGKRREIALASANKVGALAALQDGDMRHLFSSSGFLDGTWFHRAYWIYGRSFEGGWNSYYLNGKQTPAGKIMVFDDAAVYSYGRLPQYFKWTTPMEHRLFAAPRRDAAAGEAEPDGSILRVENSKSLDPTGKAVAVAARVTAQGPDGVIIVRGGGVHGYALYVRDGYPEFAVRVKNQVGTVTGPEPMPKGDTHLAGVLTDRGELRLFVNGARVATGQGPGLLPSDPADAMQIGGDEGSHVGRYSDDAPFTGVIDDVRVFFGNLPDEGVRALADGSRTIPAGDAEPVLHLSFDRGDGSDASGKKNHAAVVGAVAVPAGTGKGMRFSGRTPEGGATSAYGTLWTEAVPILVRGMAGAGDTLFLAGPEDVLDEPDALKGIDDESTVALLNRQDTVFTGTEGGILRAVSARDGKTLAEQRLPVIPVWDGLAVADGALFLAGTDGTLRRFTP